MRRHQSDTVWCVIDTGDTGLGRQALATRTCGARWGRVTRRADRTPPTHAAVGKRVAVGRPWTCRLPTAVRGLAVIGSRVRGLLTTTTASALVDFDLATGQIVRRVEDLPRFTQIWGARSGWGLGVTRTAAVGRGPTHLTALDPDLRVVDTK